MSNISQYPIDHFHNCRPFKYSFMCIKISLSSLVRALASRRERLIELHLKEYFSWSPLWKRVHKLLYQ